MSKVDDEKLTFIIGAQPKVGREAEFLDFLCCECIIKVCKQFAKLEFFRVKEHLYEIRWIWFIRK